MFIAHYCACILNFVSSIYYEFTGDSWFRRFGIDVDNWSKRYLASIYWAVTTMMTIGYGDIVPITYNEKIVTIFTMLLASVLFAYTINSIGSVIR